MDKPIPGNNQSWFALSRAVHRYYKSVFPKSICIDRTPQYDKFSASRFRKSTGASCSYCPCSPMVAQPAKIKS